MTGLHLTNLDNTPHLGHRSLSDAERAYQRDLAAWDEVERGYSAIQVDAAADGRLRADRLTGRPGGLGRREVGAVVRLRRQRRSTPARTSC